MCCAIFPSLPSRCSPRRRAPARSGRSQTVGKPGSPMERLPAPLCGRASHLRIGSPGAAKHVPCWYPALYTREQDDLLLRERELNAREQGTRKAPTFSFPFGRIISGIVVVLGVVMVVW